MNTNHYFTFNLFILIILVSSKIASSTWNFSAVNLPIDVPIWRFAIWRKRAFLAIPKFSKKDIDNSSDTNLTLLEVGWPEPGHNLTIGLHTDTSVQVFPKSTENNNECERLLSVTGLDIDIRGRLWILDSAEDYDCPSKIVIYNLRRNDEEITRNNFLTIPKRNLKSLVIDPVVGIWGPRAYIGDPGDESIITYSLAQRRWWRLKLVRAVEMPRIFCTELAISKKNSVLYLTGTKSQDIFGVDLTMLRIDEGPPPVMQNDETQNSTVKWFGTKMGSSSGMVCDQKGGLHYFLVTEHASVRWDTKHDLKTTSHSIVLQNEEVPCITDYRMDMQRNVWGLVNLNNPFVKTSSSNFTKKWDPKFRTVRIFKYNPFGI